MSFLNRQETKPLPPSGQEVIEIEEEVRRMARQEFARRPSLGDPRNMERVKSLLTSGLTSAYKDGAEALENTVKEADAALQNLKNKVHDAEEQMDLLKREAAENIQRLKSQIENVTAMVQDSMEHLTSMARWMQDQSAALTGKSPPAIAPPEGHAPAEIPTFLNRENRGEDQ